MSVSRQPLRIRGAELCSLSVPLGRQDQGVVDSPQGGQPERGAGKPGPSSPSDGAKLPIAPVPPQGRQQHE